MPIATSNRRLLRILGTLVAAAGLAAAGLAASPLTSVAAPTALTARAGHHAVVSPQVTPKGTAPTGYEVTFRHYDPTATTVQVRGEWFFSSPADTTTTSSQGVLPSQWQPGDFPIANPKQGPAPNWPVEQMTLDKATGVWSYTTPLPSGTGAARGAPWPVSASPPTECSPLAWPRYRAAMQPPRPGRPPSRCRAGSGRTRALAS